MRRLTAAERAVVARQATPAAQAAAYLELVGEGVPWNGPPLPIPRAAAVAEPLPIALVPPILRGWLCDVAERVSVPLEFVAAPALIGLGSVIGCAIGVRPSMRDDWTVTPNLWGGVVGPPGVMKSAAVAEGLRPIMRLEALAREQHDENAAQRVAEEEGREASRKAARGELEKATKKNDSAAIALAKDRLRDLSAEGAKAEASVRRFTTNDPTTEALGALLNTSSPRGVLLVRDELAGWLRGLERSDRAQDRAFYLEAWNGNGSFTVDRIGRGTTHIPNLCVSIVGGIQPGRLSAYVAGAVSGGEDADGLVQRLQVVVWPDEIGEWRNIDRFPNRDARASAYRVFDELATAEPVELGAEATDTGTPFLRFAPDAQELWTEWRTDLEKRLRGDLAKTPAFCAHVSKYRSLVPSLALIWHLAEVVGGGKVGAVSLSAARAAFAWADYLEGHARKMYSPELAGNLTAAHALAEKIKAGALSDGMTVRAIKERDWSGLTHRGSVHEAIEVLEGLGWVRLHTVEPGESGGRSSDVLFLNPGFTGGRKP